MATEKQLIYLEDAIARIVDTPSDVATMAFEGYYGFIKNPGDVLVDRQHEIIDLLEAVYTVDAVEVVHGRWIVENEVSVRCSECCFNRASIKMPLNYCPNCGAKMDGDGNG